MSTRAMPQRFGKYVLLRRIAVGGMAEIFKAKVAGRGGFEKDLVIKRILSHYNEDPDFVKMFVDEARLTAKLAHPNIVQIFDFDVQDGQYYIAMEYIEGKDLENVLVAARAAGEPLSVAQVAFIAMEVAKGLDHAHTKEDRGQLLNIVHRDVTPSNIMVSFSGDVKLMDFGIAKATERSSKTQAGAVKGKVAYMAPEQARAKHVDARTDIFALGVVMWEMLTGRRLFLAEADYDTIVNVLKMEAPPPSSVNAAVPPELDAIVLRCLQKEPDDRYPSAELLAGDLTRYYYGHVVDHDQERLKPLMYRILKEEIGRIERETLEDEALMSGVTGAAVTPEALAAVAGTVTGAVYPAEGRTSTVQHAGATMVAPIPEAPAPAEAPAKRRSPLLWLVPVLVIGAGAAVFALTRGGSAQEQPAAAVVPPVTAAPAAATLYLKVEPHTATVTVDGRPVTGEASGLEVGATVRVVAEAPGYKRFEELVQISETSPVFAVKMVRSGTPHRVLIEPPGPGDVVFVDGEKLGVGPQAFDGIVGQQVMVRVEPAEGGQATERTLVLDAAQATVAVGGRALRLALEPADATVTSSAGEVGVADGEVTITGLEAGAEVTITVEAPGFASVAQTVRVGAQEAPLAIRLEREAAGEVAADAGTAGAAEPTKPAERPSEPTKPAERPSEPAKPAERPSQPAKPAERPAPTRPERPAVGKGAITIDAKPWAQIMVDGRPYGQTPKVVKDLDAGQRTVVLTRGTKKVTRTVSVQPGKQTKVFIDFTEL